MIFWSMAERRTITVEVPEDLLNSAQNASGASVEDTICIALRLLIESREYSSLRALRGKVQFSCTATELRIDR